MTAAQPAVALAGEDVQGHQYLRLTVGGGSYLVPIDRVREILEIARMTPLPMTPEFVRGVMNLRGSVVPVIDLHARFGACATQLGRRTCIVVIEQGCADKGGMRLVGALVDGVSEVLDVPSADIEPVPSLGTPIPPQFIHGMVRARGDIYPLIDLQHTLGEEELASLIAAQNDAASPAPAGSATLESAAS